MRSPESQQVKTITLVNVLSKKIMSKPESFFTFIEVLLENDALKRIGKAMLSEAGKIFVTYW